jgi:hypothetical protein
LFVSSAIALGYTTLCLTGFTFHVQLGALVALAMLVSAGSTLVLLPALIVRFEPAFLFADRVALAPAAAPLLPVLVAPALGAALRVAQQTPAIEDLAARDAAAA